MTVPLLDDLARAEMLLAPYPAEAEAVRRAAVILADEVRAAAADTMGKARADHPDTSRKAALDALPRTGTQRSEVLRVVAHAARIGLVGLTDVEVQNVLDMVPNTERPRRVELVDGGWLRDSGKRRAHNGRDHIVWTLTEKGLALHG
jgi:hypothetical protein